MAKGFIPQKDLLDAEDVASYLDINQQTVWRWCREGRLPCLKIGKEWRIRRAALEDFVERSELPKSLTAQLRSFLQMPDNVLAIAQSPELMHQLDIAFFRIAEARNGMLVKYYSADSQPALEAKLRYQLERSGVEVTRLEEQGHLRFVPESSSPGERGEELRRLAAEAADESRSIWVCFNWEERVDLDAALRQQEEITQCIDNSLVVVKTSVLEDKLDEWPGTQLRRAQILHLGTIWFSNDGRLALSRLTQQSL
jgi:excisionase family DNA binding protein